MGRDWNKKRIIQLNRGDVQVIEEWLDEFIDVIYTWLYFHVGADANIAADLTTRTFKQAVQVLEQFTPDSESMLQWLRGQAKQARDKGLLQWQMKPQRPWAWSQLPDEVLCGLSHFRDEPLSEDVTNNPFVREIVQASLAEMEAPNRELMRRRYNHLQTPEQIAGEIGKSIQEVNDRLYRCRHFFRRVFIQLIQSENQGFAESSSSGSLELLDVNLEKLLSSTNMVQAISKKDHAKIREIVIEAARETVPLKNTHTRRKPYLIGFSTGIVVLGLLGVLVWLNPFLSTSTEESKPVTPVTIPKPEAPAVTVENPDAKSEEDTEREELRRVFQLGQAGDLDALLDVLKEGSYASQIAAALYVGQLGDESSIGLLEESEMKWYSNGPDDNPFAQAIVQIENRLLAEAGAIVEEPNEAETPAITEAIAVEKPTEKPAPPAPEPAITGIVTDFSGQPMQNAQISLSENPLYGEAANIKVLRQIETNDAGQYQFPNPPAGAFFIDCRDALESMAISRAIWYDKDVDCQTNFGGKSAVSGLLDAGSESAAEQILYLSDALDPANASFRAETVTDAEGRFSFIGIEASSYYLLNNTESNRIVRLDTLDVAEQNIIDWMVNIQRSTLAVRIEASEDTSAVSDIRLIYGENISGELQQFPLQEQEDGTYLLDAIPFGSYSLIATFENGMRLLQSLELNSDRELAISVPDGSSALSGTFTNPSPYTFFLYNSDQRVRFDLAADADGFYSIDSIPPDTYSLATVVNNLQLDFMEIDLQNEPEQGLDIDAGQLLEDFSPLYVVVTDSRGAMLNDVQVWVTGTGEVVTTQSTGRGAFLAVRPGEYTLYAALPGFSTAEKPLQVRSTPLQTEPKPDNTVRLQLASP